MSLVMSFHLKKARVFSSLSNLQESVNKTNILTVLSPDRSLTFFSLSKSTDI